MSYSDYKNLAPTDQAENCEEYISILDGALHDPYVRNIAISGSYGSGKSSVIETFLKRQKSMDRYLKVSMASFCVNEKENGTHPIQVKENEIEQGILKQFFYKVKQDEIPQSRYCKLYDNDSLYTFLRYLIFVFAIFLAWGVCFPVSFDTAVERIVTIGQYIGISPIFTIIIFASSICLFIFWIANEFGHSISRIKIKVFHFSSDVELAYDVKESSSFNKNLDEIIYFFEKTKYRYVFFEDLDRLNHNKIFVQLRELNHLLNNADAIETKPIIFIYAIRDDVFSCHERTKFFDLIIPIIPIVAPSNSGDVLLHWLNAMPEKKHTISEDFILDVAPYIDDMRILHNICNEFLVYKRTLRKDELHLSDEKIFAMIIFKNLHPKDFAEAQVNRGVIKQVFDNKPAYIEDAERIVKEQRSKAGEMNKIDAIDTLSEKLRKLPYLPLKHLLYQNNMSRLIRDTNGNELLIFLLRRGYIEEDYALYINYFKGDSLTAGDMNFILSVKNQKRNIFSYPLTRRDLVLQRLHVYDFEEKAVYNFNLLEELLLQNDNNDKLHRFVNQLSDGDSWSWRFLREFPRVTEHKGAFIKNLIKQWPDFWDSIFESKNVEKEDRLYYLALILDHADFENNIGGTTSFTISVLCENNKFFRKFFEDAPELLQELAKRVENPESISNAIDALEMEYKELTCKDVPSEVLDYIFDNKYYEINLVMIKNIIAYKLGHLPSDFPAKSYTVIKRMSYQPLLDYIYENLDDYVNSIILAQKNPCDDAVDVIDLLEHLINESGMCEELIKCESFCIQDISSCCYTAISDNREGVLSIWNQLLSYDKIDVTWHNIITYWRVFDLSETLVDFIARHVKTLQVAEQTDMNDDFIRDFVNATSHAVLKALLPVLRLKDFDLDITDMDEDLLEEMIVAGFIPFRSTYYEMFFNKDKDLAYHYILKNQEDVVKAIAGMSMNDELFERLIISEELEQKFKVIVFEQYSAEHMTEAVANQMTSLGLHGTVDVFRTAWAFDLSQSKRKDMFFAYLDQLGADDFEAVFSDLPQYKEFADRSRRHFVWISDLPENLKLVKRLEQLEYITKHKEKSALHAGRWAPTITTENALVCHVKKKG